MSDLLRLVLDTGLFLISCTVIFLVGFILDAWAQARRTAGAHAEAAGTRTPVRVARAGRRDAEDNDTASAAAA